MNVPPLGDACVRLASNATPYQFNVSFYGPIGGHGLWLKKHQTEQWEYAKIYPGLTVDVNSCLIDDVIRPIDPAILYYVYIGFQGGVPTVQLSTTGPVFDPEVGVFVKIEAGSYQRWIGAVKSVPESRMIWAAGDFGVFCDHIASFYNRQLLTSQVTIGGGNASPTWQIINTEQYISTFCWGDGADFQAMLAGSVSSSVAGATVGVGITRNYNGPSGADCGPCVRPLSDRQ